MGSVLEAHVDGLDQIGVHFLTLGIQHLGGLDGQLHGALVGGALAEVVGQSLLHLGHGDDAVLEDQLAHDGQRVSHVGDTEALRAGEVVVTSTLLYASTVGDTIVNQAGLEGQGATDGVSGVYGVVSLGHHLNEELLLCLEGVEELVEGGHLQHVHGLGADLLALVHTRGEDKLQRTNHVEEGGVVPAVGLVASGGLYATDDAVAAGILKGVAAGHHGGNDDFIVVEGGHAHTLTGDGGGLDQQGVGRTVPDTDGQGGLGQTDVHLRLHAHVGQIVGGIETVLVLTADDEVLE